MIEFDEDKEELAEEAQYEETIKALKEYAKRYKALFGKDPDKGLTLIEIQDAIVVEMTRRNLRPYKLAP